MKNLAFLLSVVAASPAAAVTINFDSLPNGAVVTNQFAPAVFSSIAGSQILTTAQNLGSSPPNFICSGVGNAINCADPVFVAFTSAITNLRFFAVGDNNVGINGLAKAFAGATLLGSVNIVGDGIGTTPYLVDLSAFTGITRIEITNTDLAGLGYDDFTFDVGVAAAVPEPSTWTMMTLALGAAGVALRHRRKRLLAP